MALRRIWIFVALTAIFTLPGYWLDAHPGLIWSRLNAAVDMWAPALAAVVTLRLTNGRLAELG